MRILLCILVDWWSRGLLGAPVAARRTCADSLATKSCKHLRSPIQQKPCVQRRTLFPREKSWLLPLAAFQRPLFQVVLRLDKR